MSLPASFPTSRGNAVASVMKYLADNIIASPWKLNGAQYENTLLDRTLSVVERPIPDVGPSAFDDYLGPAPNNGNPVYGTKRQFQLEFEISAKLTQTYRDAEKDVRLMREKLWYALYWAGAIKEDVLVMPKITLYDFADTNSPADTGSYVWWPSDEDNTWFETPVFTDAQDPNGKRIQILVRFHYFTVR